MIAICSPVKNKKYIEEFSNHLNDLGIPHYIPDMRVSKENITPCLERTLIYQHFEYIKHSDAILVLNPDGYVGISVIAEIGFAKALGKIIYFLQATGKSELDILADKITPTFEDLKILNVRVSKEYGSKA